MLSEHGLEAHATHGQDGRATEEILMAKQIRLSKVAL